MRSCADQNAAFLLLKQGRAEAMNRFYLDEDRIIQADMSSDASPVNEEYVGKNKDINLRDLGFHFSRYVQEIKRETTKHLSNISRDFNALTSHFLDQNIQHDIQDPHKIIIILKSWIPKLETFETKFKELRNCMPYIPGEKRKVVVEDFRKIKFIQILERVISKYDSPMKQEVSTNAIESPSKIQLSQQIVKIQNLHDEGNFEESITKCREQLKTHPSPQLHFILANSLKAIGSYKEAISQYTKSINLSPRACYFNNRGNAHLTLNQILKAEKDYRLAIEMQPKNQIFLGNYGNVCLSLKKFEEAIQVYNRAILIDSDNDFFYNNKAFAEIKLGELTAAIQSYNHAISLNPNNHIYLKNRANLFMEKNLIKWALDDINKAIQIQPKHEYYFLKGKWEYRSGRQHDAMHSFRRACQLEPGKQNYQKFYMAIRAQLGYK